MKVEIKDNQLVITLPISPRPSNSGKTTIVASSAGNQPTTCEHEGKPIIVGVNAYVKK
jgi:hypothetical protein